MMLLNDPEILDKSNREIAEIARVSHPFVQSVKVATGNVSNRPTMGRDGRIRGPKRRKGKPSHEVRADKTASKAIARRLATMTKRHARTRLAVLLEHARAWLADLEKRSAQTPASNEGGSS